MPEKILRLGFTEMTLLFCYWYEYLQNKFTDKKILGKKNNCIKWFYTTSGYYDNNIKSDYMDANHKNNADPENYKKYFNLIYNFIKCSNFCYAGIHMPISKNSIEFKTFYNSLNIERTHWEDYFFSKIRNYKLLVISPFAELFKIQYESGNCHKIYNDFPKLKKIQFYKNIYTFFNKGPHNNIFETVDFLINDIKKKVSDDYNMVVISAGAYSNLLAERFYNLDKHVYVLGGELQGMFGIINKRQKEFNKTNKNNNLNKNYESNKENKKYWITEIPDKYKPQNYMKIEKGCYW